MLLSTASWQPFVGTRDLLPLGTLSSSLFHTLQQDATTAAPAESVRWWAVVAHGLGWLHATGRMDSDREPGDALHADNHPVDDGAPLAARAPSRATEADGHVGGDLRLHIACRAGDMDTVEALLVQAPSIDVNACDAEGRTPLFHAASKGRTAVVAALLAQGERIAVDLPSPRTGATVLVGAAGSGRTEVVELLLADGRADPCSVGLRKRGALHGAALYGHAAVAKLLIDDVRLGPNGMHAADETGRTPLLDAAAKGHVAVLRVFIEAARRSDCDMELFSRAAAAAEEAGYEKAAGELRAAASDHQTND